MNYVDPLGLEDIPVRKTVEALGGTVTWYPENKSFTVDFGSRGQNAIWGRA